MPDRPLVVLRPAPHGIERIFSPEAQARLHRGYDVVLLEGDARDDAELDAVLPRAFAIVGQPDLPAERLERRRNLRAVLNVEGNFFPTSTTRPAFEQGIHVLGCGPAYAQAVAEYALGLAIDLARGISREDRAFRAGRERYVVRRQRRRGPAARLDHRAGRLRQPRPRAAPPARALRRRHPRLRPVAARRRPARAGRHARAAGRGLGVEPVRVRARHRHGREPAPARRPRARPRAVRRPAGPRQPGGRGRLRRAARPGSGRPVPRRRRRLARGADARRPPSARLEGLVFSATGPAASPRRSSRSARWSSTTCC